MNSPSSTTASPGRRDTDARSRQTRTRFHLSDIPRRPPVRRMREIALTTNEPALVMWDPRMLGYDLGGKHPLHPLRWELTWRVRPAGEHPRSTPRSAREGRRI
jgi:hypothetical protein